MSKNSQAFIAILPLLGVLALAPTQVEKLGRGIASETPAQDVKASEQQPKKEEVKTEAVKEPKNEVEAKVEPKKEEAKKEEPKKEVVKEEAKKEEPKKEKVKITVADAKKDEKKDEKKEEKNEDCPESESLKVVSSQLKELMTQQQSLITQMGQMQQLMAQQKAELEQKMLIASINQASLNASNNMLANQYFNYANPYGGQMGQIYSPLGADSIFSQYSPYQQQGMGMGGMGMYGQYPGGMMGGYQSYPMMGQPPQFMQQGLMGQPEFSPMQVTSGCFGLGNQGFDMGNPNQQSFPIVGNFGKVQVQPGPLAPFVPAAPVAPAAQGQSYGFTL